MSTPTATSAPNTAASSQTGDGAGETQKCKHCQKEKPKNGFKEHSKACLREKKEKRARKEAAKESGGNAKAGSVTGKDKDGDSKMDNADGGDNTPTAGDDDTTSIAGSIKAATNGSAKAKAGSAAADKDSAKKQGKKRKAEAADTDNSTNNPPKKKQKKKDALAATKGSAGNSAGGAGTGGKPKGPVDVERQCGVLLPNGGMCARSLTCKSHAMGAKRAVPGRSAPYDVLLAAYQKKNQAKQHKAALAAQEPLAEDLGDGTGEGRNVDSDEEREAVMAGVARAAARPLFEEGGGTWGVRGRVGYVRVKEALRNAMAGNTGLGLFATGRTAGVSGHGHGWPSAGFVPGGTMDSMDLGQTHSRRQSSVGQQGRRQMSIGQTAS